MLYVANKLIYTKISKVNLYNSRAVLMMGYTVKGLNYDLICWSIIFLFSSNIAIAALFK